jgi:inner membrane transporter RhtA
MKSTDPFAPPRIPSVPWVISIASLPPVPSIVLAVLSVQGGAALARGLFPLLGPPATAALRVGLAALILLLLVRPPLLRLRAEQWRAVVPYGLALGGMNLLFYLAIARIPLGLVVALEFVVPLGAAALTSRRALDALWVALAGAGITLIIPWGKAIGTSAGASGLDPLGVLLGLLAGGCWTAYIVLGQRTSRLLAGASAVATGMAFALLAILPFALATGGLARLAHLTPRSWAQGAALALLSSAVPFTLEMNALRALPARTYGILMSLEPAVAALCGLVFLQEYLTAFQWLAVALVIAASAGATLTAATAREAPLP